MKRLLRNLRLICRILALSDLIYSCFEFAVLKNVQMATYFLVMAIALWVMGGEGDEE